MVTRRFPKVLLNPAAVLICIVSFCGLAFAVPNCVIGKLCGNTCIPIDRECHIDPVIEKPAGQPTPISTSTVTTPTSSSARTSEVAITSSQSSAGQSPKVATANRSSLGSSYWIVAIVIVVGIGIIAGLAGVKGKVLDLDTSGEAKWPFFPKRPLTRPEQVLYFRLKKALPEHIILAQVQLSRILGVRKGHNYWAWNNRINRMSADFVVCNKDSGIVAVSNLTILLTNGRTERSQIQRKTGHSTRLESR